MKYLVTKEIKSETQIVWQLYFRDFVFLSAWAVLNILIKDAVHSYFQIPFGVFAVIAGILLVVPGAANPERRQYQSLALFLSAKKETLYHIRESKDGEQEKENPKHKRRYPGRKI